MQLLFNLLYLPNPCFQNVAWFSSRVDISVHTYCSVVAVVVHLRIFFFNDLHAMVIVYVKCPVVGVKDAHGHFVQNQPCTFSGEHFASESFTNGCVCAMKVEQM